MEILYCNWQLNTKLNNVAYKITLAHYLLSLLVYYVEVKPQNKMRGFKGAWNRQSNETKCAITYPDLKNIITKLCVCADLQSNKQIIVLQKSLGQTLQIHFSPF